jgi:hypothetical protein
VNKKISIFSGIFCAIVITSFLIYQDAIAGFGVSPGTISEENLIPGATLERTIYLVQGNQTEDIGVVVSVESKDVSDWITFPDGSEFIIPAGVQQYPLRTVISVPKNADLGIYNAFIRISTQPKKVEGSQITVALGGRVTLNLNVGDNLISDFLVKQIEIFDIREGDKPKVEVTITNNGNVSASPENSSFELFNKYGEIRLAYGENDNFEKVAPFSEGKTILEYPLNLKLSVGEYWGHVKIYNDGKVIKELKTVFNVTEGGLFARHLYSIISVGIVLIITIIYFTLRSTKRRRR